MTEKATEHVEDASERMRTAREGRGKARLEQRAFRDLDLDEVVEAVVKQDLRVEYHDHVDAEEHLEHVFVEIEVDRAFRLRIGAGPIEDHAIADALHGAAELVGSVAASVVADVVFEDELLFGDGLLNELRHRALVALERASSAATKMSTPKRSHISITRRSAVRHAATMALKSLRFQCRQAALVEREVEDILLQHALLVDLDRRDRDAFLEDRGGIGRQAARHLATDIGHVAEHRAPADEAPVLVEDRQQNQPVIGVADRALALVRVGHEEDVAIFDVAIIGAQKSADERPNWPTTMRPLRSAINGNSSCCSRMPGDMAVRKSTASIS